MTVKLVPSTNRQSYSWRVNIRNYWVNIRPHMHIYIYILQINIVYLTCSLLLTIDIPRFVRPGLTFVMYQRIASPAAVHVSMHPAALARPWGKATKTLQWVLLQFYGQFMWYISYTLHIILTTSGIWSLNVVIYIYIWKIAFYSIDK